MLGLTLTISFYLTSSSCFPDSFIPDAVRPQFDSAWGAMKELSQAKSVDDIDLHSIPYAKGVLCKACQLSLDFLITSYKYYVPEEVIKTSLITLCSVIQPNKVCQGAIRLNMPIFIEILKRKPELRGEHFCGTIFEQYCTDKPLVEWTVVVADSVNSTVAKKKNPEYASSSLEVAHITDTHVDLQYSSGVPVKGCREPLCCRRTSDQSQSTSQDGAGQWGDYRSCDIPLTTVENMLHTLHTQHKKIKLVYMTGDLIAHNVWETTKEKNIEQIQEQAVVFREILGGDVEIYPALGNHEPHPANVLAPPQITEYSAEWLYEVFYDSWCKHFPPEAKVTFLKGGFYSVSPISGFRIISLNSLFGYVFNWWMVLDPIDPGGQLQWLNDELMVAESNGEKVHIIMHGPPSETDTLLVWSREYHRIIHRFKSTVIAQFVGHTHRDQFYLSHDPVTHEPLTVTWNGGSVTPFTNVNPNYRIYNLNAQTFEVEDFDTYIYNLTEANMNVDQTPAWFKLYSFREAYNIPSLRPADVATLARRLARDDQLFYKYFLYYMSDSDIAYKKGCGKACKRKQLCKIISMTSNRTKCQNILYPEQSTKIGLINTK